jgi:hypothetical protein
MADAWGVRWSISGLDDLLIALVNDQVETQSADRSYAPSSIHWAWRYLRYRTLASTRSPMVSYCYLCPCLLPTFHGLFHSLSYNAGGSEMKSRVIVFCSGTPVANPALDLAPFGRWTLRDKPAQRRSALR